MFARCRQACLLFALTGFSSGPNVVVSADETTNEPSTSAEGIEFFESKIRPVLVENCFPCHSREAKSVKGKLLLDRREDMRHGGESGSAVVPGDPAASLLIEAVNYESYQMPPAGKLPEQTIADLKRWIEIGAPWPAERTTAPASLLKGRIVDDEMIEQARQEYWAFQPAERQPLPDVSDPDWPRTRIDHFTLHHLDEQGLMPASPANRRMLIRRVYFDVIGLPPRFDEVNAFVADTSPDAYAQLVERLLSSPQYGEHWARFWLDVVRYAEDHPNGALPPRYPHRYRDWLIKSLNDDLRYDEFIRRQLAADSMDDLPREELAALGFLGLSPKYVIDEKFAQEIVQTIVADEWDERVDMVTRGLLGLTVACARCHDHKYDPITTRDYYALAGVMANTQTVETPLTPMFDEDAKSIAALTEDLRFHEKRYNARYNQRKGLINDKEPDIYRYDKEILESASEIQRIKSLLPANYENVPRANAVRDAAVSVNPEFYVIRELISPEARFWRHVEYDPEDLQDLPVHIRGSVTQLGEIVPRRFLAVLSDDEPEPFRLGSGRRELAEAILTDGTSLAGRVIVNRIWGWHFGKALVRSPSNFGALGERPSHPQLLDDLTARFIAGGWSLKELHREILLSATYRQSCTASENDAMDSDNVHLSRMNRRRLTVECWRDAMLSVAGELNPQIGGPSFDLIGKEPRRTLYGRVSREKLANILQLFDFPEATRHNDERSVTTTALQQLYFLNSPFVQQRAESIVRQVGERPSDHETITQVFHRVLARSPSAQESAAAKELIQHNSTLDETSRRIMLAQALLASNEFLFVD